MRTHQIAIIPGDGIGKEVMPEGVRVLDAARPNMGPIRPNVPQAVLIGVVAGLLLGFVDGRSLRISRFDGIRSTLLVAVRQRPPQRSSASNTAWVRPAAATRRAAATPAAPAPTITTSKSAPVSDAATAGRTIAAPIMASARRRLTLLRTRLLISEPHHKQPGRHVSNGRHRS